MIAVLLSWPLGYFYVSWAAFTCVNQYRYYRSGVGYCDTSWRRYFNGCDNTYSGTLGWFELIVVTAVVVVLAALIARWVLRPVHDMAELVQQYGPNSLGLRLGADGPADETRALAAAIDAMLDRVGAGYEAQRRFASNASHELRTPLATQRALIEISLSADLSADAIALLTRQLLATNERNERLIDGLLTLAETDQGLQARTSVRLDEVVAEALESHRPTADKAGVTLHAALIPVAVDGERALLERLVANLVQNAIKYNDADGTVDVVVGADATLTVANTGPTVPAEQVDGLFEPFRRMSGDRLDHGGGVGLGLTIVRSIAAAHGGAVSATPRPGGGLIVTVHLTAR